MLSRPADGECDAVYTWVDDAWPGYMDLLRKYSSTRHDLNPNRTRDNLQILKYSLRSLDNFLPWIRRVFLVTCRPQVPSWLNRRTVCVVHHDEFMPGVHLPTFNSFAIVAHLHRVPGVARRFVYVEDDRIFGRPIELSDFFDSEGRPIVYEALRATPRARRQSARRLSPWNLALAHSNALLDERFGRKRRGQTKFAPLAIDSRSWAEMIGAWPDAFARTTASRFRAEGNVAPEHLYPHFLLATRSGVAAPVATTLRHAWYHPINNVAVVQRVGIARLTAFSPKFACLNDNFGSRPEPSIVRFVQQALERWFPRPSRFEV
jgi:hypothetical protein